MELDLAGEFTIFEFVCNNMQAAASIFEARGDWHLHDFGTQIGKQRRSVGR